MENSIIIRCPCCGQSLEVFPGNWLMDSVVRLLPTNIVQDTINSQNNISLGDRYNLLQSQNISQRRI